MEVYSWKSHRMRGFPASHVWLPKGKQEIKQGMFWNWHISWWRGCIPVDKWLIQLAMFHRYVSVYQRVSPSFCLCSYVKYWKVMICHDVVVPYFQTTPFWQMLVLVRTRPTSWVVLSFKVQANPNWVWISINLWSKKNYIKCIKV